MTQRVMAPLTLEQQAQTPGKRSPRRAPTFFPDASLAAQALTSAA